jgi:hypothetical protein
MSPIFTYLLVPPSCHHPTPTSHRRHRLRRPLSNDPSPCQKSTTSPCPPIQVLMPTDNTIASSHTAEIHLSGLPPATLQCHVFLALASSSLLSISLLCNHGCIVTFCKNYIKVHLHDSLLLTGHHSPQNGLWNIDLPAQQPTTHHHINAVTTPITHTVADRVAFYHASMFSLPISTLVLDNFLQRGLALFAGFLTNNDNVLLLVLEAMIMRVLSNKWKFTQ